MAVDEMLLAWLKQVQSELLQQLQTLQSGKLATGEKAPLGTAWVDTTARDIVRIKRKLGELDGILSRLVSQRS